MEIRPLNGIQLFLCLDKPVCLIAPERTDRHTFIRIGEVHASVSEWSIGDWCATIQFRHAVTDGRHIYSHVVFETAFGLVSPLEIHLDTAVVRLADIGVGVAGISHVDRHRSGQQHVLRCLVIILEAEDHAGVKEACVKTDIQRFSGFPFNIRIAQSAHGNTLIQGLILSRSE